MTPETVKLELASASVSFDKTPLPALIDICASSLTAPVSFTPTGSSSIPFTVKVIVAVSDPVPSVTVYVNVSVAISPASRALALLAL